MVVYRRIEVGPTKFEPEIIIYFIYIEIRCVIVYLVKDILLVLLLLPSNRIKTTLHFKFDTSLAEVIILAYIFFVLCTN